VEPKVAQHLVAFMRMCRRWNKTRFVQESGIDRSRLSCYE
jgi:hypothetical protein